MRDKYLYFGIDPAATMAFDDHAAQTLQLTTGGFDNPLPTGTAVITNGVLKVTVLYNANHTYGTAYTSAAFAGNEIDITAACTYDGTDTITIATAAADAVNGWTKSSTASENDLDVTQLKPYVEGNGYVYNSKHLKGIAVSGAATTAVNFLAKTGDAATVDVLTVTHGSAKHKEFAQSLLEHIGNDNKKATGIIVVQDDIRGLSLPNDGGNFATAAIASQAATLDT